MGLHPSTQALVRDLVARITIPMVVDADGINALAGAGEWLRRAGGPLVLTPHPGECSRLLGVPSAQVLRDRISLVQKSGADLGLTLVLKMARTLIGDPATGVAVVPTGNPGMATGGTGDVLTGLIAGLIARGTAPALAARAGAYVHGLAGDLAAERVGPEAMLAGDLLECVPEAIRRVKAESAEGNSATWQLDHWAMPRPGDSPSGKAGVIEGTCPRSPGSPWAGAPGRSVFSP